MKRILSLFLAMALAMVACAFAEAPFPIAVTDQAGRSVVIEEVPQRIITSYYISTSMLIALGLDDCIVGMENQAEKRPIYALSAPELLELPSIGTAKELDLEGCVALEPDLLVLPMKLIHSEQMLEDLGLTAIFINPENQELLNESIELIAAATGTQQTAEALLAFIHAQQNWLEADMADTDRSRVYLAGNSSMLSTAGDAMYQSDMIRLGGGSNVAGEIQDDYWVEIDYEQLLAWDPEYIILASAASYSCDDVLNDPNLAECTAVVNGNVYQVPETAEAWDSPVPGGILGSVWLASVLHPEVCSSEKREQIIEEFYETFYDFAYGEI